MTAVTFIGVDQDTGLLLTPPTTTGMPTGTQMPMMVCDVNTINLLTRIAASLETISNRLDLLASRQGI